MKILAFLQNQWVLNPQKWRAILEKNPDRREALIARLLFSSRCLTARRLEKAFGVELCRQIVWEESSREVGDHSSSRFKADLLHISQVLAKHNPDIVMAFGWVAGNALVELYQMGASWKLIPCLHPAARNIDIESRLNRAAADLRCFMAATGAGCGGGA